VAAGALHIRFIFIKSGKGSAAYARSPNVRSKTGSRLRGMPRTCICVHFFEPCRGCAEIMVPGMSGPRWLSFAAGRTPLGQRCRFRPTLSKLKSPPELTRGGVIADGWFERLEVAVTRPASRAGAFMKLPTT
jgi:hypothetical protein